MDLGSNFVIVLRVTSSCLILKCQNKTKDHTMTYLAHENALCLAGFKQTLLKSLNSVTCYSNFFNLHNVPILLSAHSASFFNIQGQAVWPRVEFTILYFSTAFRVLEIIHSSDQEEVPADTWSECSVPPPWGSDPTHDACMGNEVTWVPREGLQLTALLCSWTTFKTQQIKATSSGQTAASAWTLSSQMPGTSGADTLLRSFFGWRTQTLFGVQRGAPLPLLVSLFGLRGTVVLAAWELFCPSAKSNKELKWGSGEARWATLLHLKYLGIHLINITWPKPKNEMLACKETVTTFTYSSLGTQPRIVAENFPKANKTRQYICLFRGFLVALMAVITRFLYLDQRIIQHKTFWIDKLPFCLMKKQPRKTAEMSWPGSKKARALTIITFTQPGWENNFK